MRNFLKPSAFAAATALAVSVAGLSAAQAQITSEDQWNVVMLEGEELTSAEGYTLNFADGQISGRACNRFMGRVGFTATAPGQGSIYVGRVASTMMACQGRVGELEQTLHFALGNASDYRIEADGSLVLFNDLGDLIRAVPNPNAVQAAVEAPAAEEAPAEGEASTEAPAAQ